MNTLTVKSKCLYMQKYLKFEKKSSSLFIFSKCEMCLKSNETFVKLKNFNKLARDSRVFPLFALWERHMLTIKKKSSVIRDSILKRKRDQQSVSHLWIEMPLANFTQKLQILTRILQSLSQWIFFKNIIRINLNITFHHSINTIWNFTLISADFHFLSISIADRNLLCLKVTSIVVCDEFFISKFYQNFHLKIIFFSVRFHLLCELTEFYNSRQNNCNCE